jgi:hypothetical protein
MPKRLKIFPQFSKIVDLSIENNPNGFLPIRHRLVSTGKIDDREPPKTKSDRALDIVPLIVRAAMSKSLRHLLYVLTKNRR